LGDPGRGAAGGEWRSTTGVDLDTDLDADGDAASDLDADPDANVNVNSPCDLHADIYTHVWVVDGLPGQSQPERSLSH
jgi:hypothetical protein